MKILLRIIGILGLVLFGLLFGSTYGVPESVEESAKGFVKKQIEDEIREKYQNSRASTLTKKALKIANDLGYEENKMREDIKKKLPEKIAEVIASLCGYDCERKKTLTKSITAGYMEQIANIQVAQQQLGQIIKGKYMKIVGNLRMDLRIFSGSNATMFLILLLISLLKPKAVAHLFLPGIFLVISTITASTIYIFGQDWFYTIIYNDYMGFGYLVYIFAIFGFLMDIVFNRARITTEIINGILNAVGSTISVFPC
jgi:GH24 family phage-related lysozyme (muramidase)